MSKEVLNLKPKEFFKYFYEISKIPRGSGNEKQISDYLCNFAKEHSLEYIQDDSLNVIIKKKGTTGYENSKPVIIQGHMDMVCEKNNDKIHNFDTDPLELRIVDDYVYANNTTLGADDGISLAYGLAILDSNEISHPPLEIIFTTEEETTMKGAENLDCKNISSTYLINLDSSKEGIILVGCAGGIDAIHSINIESEKNNNLISYEINVQGLLGGHSGGEIHRQRANSNILMGRILYLLKKEIDFNISYINGGLKINAIPRESKCIININKNYADKIKDVMEDISNILKNEYKSTDKNLQINIDKIDTQNLIFSNKTTNKIIQILFLTPYGVQTMSKDIEGLVQSSTNLGVVKIIDNQIVFENAIRSSVKSLKIDIVNKMKHLASVLDCDFQTRSGYPEWEYNPKSKLKDISTISYKNLFHTEPKVLAVHTGLECGILAEKINNLDAIAIGCNAFDIHTPNEHISISSVNRFWLFLIQILKNMH